MASAHQLLFLACLVLHSQLYWGVTAHAGNPAPDPCEVEYLKAAIHSKEIDSGILIVPKKITLSIGKDETDRYFEIGLKVWKEEWRPGAVQRLKQIASKSLAGEILTSDEVIFLTDRRASLKELRFLFKALEDDHEAPQAVDELTIALGKLRDRSIEFSKARLSAGAASAPDGSSLKEREKAAKEAAQRFLAAISKKNMARIKNAIEDFDPAKRENFRHWLENATEESLKITRAGRGTADKFHDLRKNMQAMLSVVQFKAGEAPHDVEWKNIQQAFVNITEKLGNMVGEYEDRELKGQLNFNHDEVEFPADLMSQAIDLLERVKKGAKDH